MVALLQVGAEGSEKMAELIKKHSGPFQMQVIFYNPHFSPSITKKLAWDN